jgi:hypothetical protein
MFYSLHGGLTENAKKTLTNQAGPAKQSNDWQSQDFNPVKRREEEMALYINRKNRKKYTHLYLLEKYFK